MTAVAAASAPATATKAETNRIVGQVRRSDGPTRSAGARQSYSLSGWMNGSVVLSSSIRRSATPSGSCYLGLRWAFARLVSKSDTTSSM